MLIRKLDLPTVVSFWAYYTYIYIIHISSLEWNSELDMSCDLRMNVRQIKSPYFLFLISYWNLWNQFLQITIIVYFYLLTFSMFDSYVDVEQRLQIYLFFFHSAEVFSLLNPFWWGEVGSLKNSAWWRQLELVGLEGEWDFFFPLSTSCRCIPRSNIVVHFTIQHRNTAHCTLYRKISFWFIYALFVFPFHEEWSVLK